VCVAHPAGTCPSLVLAMGISTSLVVVDSSVVGAAWGMVALGVGKVVTWLQPEIKRIPKIIEKTFIRFISPLLFLNSPSFHILYCFCLSTPL
jgi:hypothetical protein